MKKREFKMLPWTDRTTAPVTLIMRCIGKEIVTRSAGLALIGELV